jgi:hypothetical protein
MGRLYAGEGAENVADCHALHPRCYDGGFAIHRPEPVMKSATSLQPVKPFSTRNVLRVLLGAGVLLLVPLVAMRFTAEVRWDAFDFAAAAVLLVGAGLALELALARLRTRTSRLAAGAVIVLALLATWAELAVGIFH